MFYRNWLVYDRLRSRIVGQNRVVLSTTYQSLHRLSANGVKLCGFVGLVNVSIAVDLKSSKNLANRSKSGDKLESPSQKLTSGIFPF